MNIIRMIKSSRMKWAEHVVCMAEKFLQSKETEGKRPL
jgi:hypothetical protein